MDCVTVCIAITLSSALRVKQEAQDAYLQNLCLLTPFVTCLLNPWVAVIGRWVLLLLGLFGISLRHHWAKPSRTLLCNAGHDLGEAFLSWTIHCKLMACCCVLLKPLALSAPQGLCVDWPRSQAAQGCGSSQLWLQRHRDLTLQSSLV